jgi:osmotically inducible lipoprotein OsmB
MKTLSTHNATVYTGIDGPGITAGHAAPIRLVLRHLAGIVMLSSLMACGSMPGERAVSGAGIGAGAGAAVGAVTGMGVGTGAAIGAAAGAAAGGLTKEDDVNLGKPVWK